MFRLVPLSDPGVSVLITNSNVKHQLTGSEYQYALSNVIDMNRVPQKTSFSGLIQIDAISVGQFQMLFKPTDRQ